MQEENEEVEQSGGGGLNAEVIRSYLAFAVASIKARKAMIASIVLVGLVLTVLVVRLIPKTYKVTTVLMTVETAVLDGDRGGPRSWAGAEGLIMRRENLESLIKSTNLMKTYAARRPPLLKAKDRVVQALVGPLDDKTLMSVLVGTLETRLTVAVEKDTLEIDVMWSDATTAADLAAAAKDGFLRVRHRAEISAFQEKMAILDTHASKLREEIDALAIQLNESLQLKAAEKAAALSKSGAAGAGKSGLTVLRTLRRSSGGAIDEQLPELREQLATLKQKLAAVESDRANRIATERARLDELKVKFTSNHPQVIAQEERLGVTSQVPSELALLRSEASDLQAQVKQREAMAKTGALGSAQVTTLTTRPAAGGGDPLPTEILSLLDRDDADPAVTAQMSGAVIRYGALRDEVRGAKMALDTAQAAFNHRYQVVIPVETPNKHAKPNLAIVGAVGVILSLLLAFALPVLLELRRGVLVERWQVDHLQLPVLADLRLPGQRER